MTVFPIMKMNLFFLVLHESQGWFQKEPQSEGRNFLCSSVDGGKTKLSQLYLDSHVSIASGEHGSYTQLIVCYTQLMACQYPTGETRSWQAHQKPTKPATGMWPIQQCSGAVLGAPTLLE